MNTANYRPKGAFIIPTLDNEAGLNNLLSDIRTQYGDAFPVIVVNNSTKKLHVKADVVNQGKNTGFARAVNDGARYAIHKYKALYLIIVNDDVSFKTDWVHGCLQCMLEYRWDAVAPLLMRSGVAENYGYRVLKSGKIELLKSKGDGPMDGITAAALIITVPTFLRMNGFDERFFAYLEDVDFFLRMKKSRHTYGLCTHTHVHHYGQGTSSRMPVRKAWWDLRNWIYIIVRHWTWDDVRHNAKDIVLERLRNISGLLKSLIPSI